MKVFIQINDAGLCIPRRTLNAAQSSKQFDIVIQTDDNRFPCEIMGAWQRKTAAGREPFWIAISYATANETITERIIRTTVKC